MQEAMKGMVDSAAAPLMFCIDQLLFADRHTYHRQDVRPIWRGQCGGETAKLRGGGGTAAKTMGQICQRTSGKGPKLNT